MMLETSCLVTRIKCFVLECALFCIIDKSWDIWIVVLKSAYEMVDSIQKYTEECDVVMLGHVDVGKSTLCG